jgi:hypothetical protein
MNKLTSGFYTTLTAIEHELEFMGNASGGYLYPIDATYLLETHLGNYEFSTVEAAEHAFEMMSRLYIALSQATMAEPKQ